MEKEQKGLTTRQHRLKTFLEDNFISGKFFSIKEICESVKYTDGSPCYQYDDSITTHDHCLALGNDVRAINQCMVDGWKLLIKDERGGVKLAENKAEFMDWYDAEYKKHNDAIIRLNMMKSKAERDGFMPILNQRGNPRNIEKDLIPIEAYAKPTEPEIPNEINGVKVYTRVLIDWENKIAYIVTAQKINIEDDLRSLKARANFIFANGTLGTLTGIQYRSLSYDDFKAQELYRNFRREYLR